MATVTVTDRATRVLFHWDHQSKILKVYVPAKFDERYIQALRKCVGLHLLRTSDVWFKPVPPHEYTLCIFDGAGEPLALGFTSIDWLNDPPAPHFAGRGTARIAFRDGSIVQTVLKVGRT